MMLQRCSLTVSQIPLHFPFFPFHNKHFRDSGVAMSRLPTLLHRSLAHLLVSGSQLQMPSWSKASLASRLPEPSNLAIPARHVLLHLAPLLLSLRKRLRILHCQLYPRFPSAFSAFPGRLADILPHVREVGRADRGLKEIADFGGELFQLDYTSVSFGMLSDTFCTWHDAEHDLVIRGRGRHTQTLIAIFDNSQLPTLIQYPIYRIQHVLCISPRQRLIHRLNRPGKEPQDRHDRARPLRREVWDVRCGPVDNELPSKERGAGHEP